jgi:hypothetical protein
MPNPTGRPPKLTPEVVAQIAASVRAGGFPHTAAEAAGVSLRTYYRWRARGEAEGRGRYQEFWHTVCQAAAEARLIAEAAVFKASPEAWLTKGPGRTTPQRPGWTETYDVRVHQAGGPLEIRVVYVHKEPPAQLAPPTAENVRRAVDGEAGSSGGA